LRLNHLQCNDETLNAAESLRTKHLEWQKMPFAMANDFGPSSSPRRISRRVLDECTGKGMAVAMFSRDRPWTVVRDDTTFGPPSRLSQRPGPNITGERSLTTMIRVQNPHDWMEL